MSAIIISWQNWSNSTDLSINSYRSVNDGVHSQDGRLGRVDDRRTHHGTEHSSIGDGERSTIHILDR